MLESVYGFDWDDGNRDKCQKHGVSVNEIEALFTNDLHIFPDLAHSATETRYLPIGHSPKGRHVFLAFTLRLQHDQRVIRPISARYMHQKEVKYYEEEIAKLTDR